MKKIFEMFEKELINAGFQSKKEEVVNLLFEATKVKANRDNISLDDAAKDIINNTFLETVNDSTPLDIIEVTGELFGAFSTNAVKKYGADVVKAVNKTMTNVIITNINRLKANLVKTYNSTIENYNELNRWIDEKAGNQDAKSDNRQEDVKRCSDEFDIV